jgi:hypothetical protein
MIAAVTTERFPVRVMVTPVWDTVSVSVDRSTTIGHLKREALREATRAVAIDDREYQVKFRGAAVDDAITIGALGAGPNAPFIVLPARRQPVR